MFYGGSRSQERFEARYHVNSTGLRGKDVMDGDKIFLPPSAFERLARMAVDYPMLFEVTTRNGKRTHCGVLEFSSDEGFCYMPYWMMKNLGLDENDVITVKNVSLKKATFVKFRAQSVDFLEVKNHRALLEIALRAFTCLTVGDIVRIPHLFKTFDLEVREVNPDGAASIIETDCNVDFEEPVGYKESKYAEYERKAKEAADNKLLADSMPRPLQKARLDANDEADGSNGAAASFKAFGGAPKRIDGKVIGGSTASAASNGKEAKGSDAKGADDSKANGSSSSSNSYSNGSKATEPAATAVPVAFESKIGDKYSKKKTAVSAFMGAPRKLSG